MEISESAFTNRLFYSDLAIEILAIEDKEKMRDAIDDLINKAWEEKSNSLRFQALVGTIMHITFLLAADYSFNLTHKKVG